MTREFVRASRLYYVPSRTPVTHPSTQADDEEVRRALEAKTEHLMLTTLRDMGDTAWDVTETVATDGGATVDGLAEQLGKHPATIYRAISDLGEIFDLDDGEVSFRVRKYKDELRALVESAEYAIESYADRIQHVMGLADHVAESSPFQKWLAENGADLEFDQEGNPKRLRIDAILLMLKGNSYESARRVAQEAIDAWRHSGNDVLHFSSVQMVWRMPVGGHDSHRVGKLATW